MARMHAAIAVFAALVVLLAGTATAQSVFSTTGLGLSATISANGLTSSSAVGINYGTKTVTSPSVAFLVTVAGSGITTLVVNACYAKFDTVAAIFNATSQAQLAFNDNSTACVTASASGGSYVTAPVVAGVPVTVVVAGASASASGAFTLTVSAANGAAVTAVSTNVPASPIGVVATASINPLTTSTSQASVVTTPSSSTVLTGTTVGSGLAFSSDGVTSAPAVLYSFTAAAAATASANATSTDTVVISLDLCGASWDTIVTLVNAATGIRTAFNDQWDSSACATGSLATASYLQAPVYVNTRYTVIVSGASGAVGAYALNLTAPVSYVVSATGVTVALAPVVVSIGVPVLAYVAGSTFAPPSPPSPLAQATTAAVTAAISGTVAAGDFGPGTSLLFTYNSLLQSAMGATTATTYTTTRRRSLLSTTLVTVATFPDQATAAAGVTAAQSLTLASVTSNAALTTALGAKTITGYSATAYSYPTLITNSNSSAGIPFNTSIIIIIIITVFVGVAIFATTFCIVARYRARKAEAEADYAATGNARFTYVEQLPKPTGALRQMAADVASREGARTVYELPPPAKPAPAPAFVAKLPPSLPGVAPKLPPPNFNEQATQRFMAEVERGIERVVAAEMKRG